MNFLYKTVPPIFDSYSTLAHYEDIDNETMLSMFIETLEEEYRSIPDRYGVESDLIRQIRVAESLEVSILISVI